MSERKERYNIMILKKRNERVDLIERETRAREFEDVVVPVPLVLPML